ncbi:MAG: virulence protein [Ruminococcus sp.]|nr:virulence protein [Ruminococcus sp.]
MEIKFNCTGAERKRLVQAISEITGENAKYQFMPTCAYNIGTMTVDKDGTLHCEDGTEISELLEKLHKRGFIAETEKADNRLTISIPKETLDEQTLTNLDRILENKGTLIRHALETDSLEYTVTESEVQFPWFTLEQPEDADAYSRFLTALIDMAKNQKRINNKPDTSNNEKYAFRCFLLRLGFIGIEFKSVRKVLLRHLTGSSAFRNGGCPNMSQDAVECEWYASTGFEEVASDVTK